jgi:hypothetical protein
MGLYRVSRLMLAVVVGTLGTTLALTACAPVAGPPSNSTASSLAELAEEQLADLPGVKSVAAAQSPIGHQSGPDRWNADLWSIDVDVTMNDDAPEDDVANAAERTHRFSTKYARNAHWSARILAGGSATKYDQDTTALPAIQLEVFPKVWHSPSQAARAIMQVASVAGVNRVAVAADWPLVDVIDANDLGSVYDQVQSLPLFESGGHFGTSDGRVRISDVPEHLSDLGVQAIITTAATYPRANVWVEAAPHGWPVLYVDHVTSAEAGAITARLSAPDMVAANTETYAVPFFVSVTGPDGRVDSNGTFGSLPPA